MSRRIRDGAARCAATAGRRLDRSLDVAIRAAVLQVLAEVGYRRLTMDDVALAARVSKATIYRRWPSKADLLVSIIHEASDETLTVPDTGSLRGDLIALLTALTDILGGPGGGASRALLSAMTDEPALAEAFRRGPLHRWAQAFIAVFERAIRRGEFSPAVLPSMAAEAGSAILLQRWLISGQPVDSDVAQAVVDDVMMPLFERLSGR
jgi:AcrR family transcriptional regulator